MLIPRNTYVTKFKKGLSWEPRRLCPLHLARGLGSGILQGIFVNVAKVENSGRPSLLDKVQEKVVIRASLITFSILSLGPYRRPAGSSSIGPEASTFQFDTRPKIGGPGNYVSAILRISMVQ